MRIFLFVSLFFLLAVSVASAAERTIDVKSAHAVVTTADRLEQVLLENGMTVFARIDHAAGAASVGLELRPTLLVIFGNPKVGSPLMQCQQTVALDLPQKALIWEAEDGQVWLTYNEPEYLAERHHLGNCAEQVLQKVAGVLAKFSQAATAAAN